MAPNFAERFRPVEPARFRFALGIYHSAATMRYPFQNPETFGLNLVDDDGSVSRINFADRPENRGLLAIKKEFAGDPDWESIGYRVLSFSEILRDRKLTEWKLVRTNERGETEVHEAVIHAAAQVPFRKSGSVDRQALRSIAKTEYSRIGLEPASNSA